MQEHNPVIENRQFFAPILGNLQPVGCRYFELMNFLEESGFRAFRPFWDYLIDACQGDSERESWLLYNSERCKEELCSTADVLYSVSDLAASFRGYQSTYISQLRFDQMLAANARNEDELMLAWQNDATLSELHPLLMRLMRENHCNVYGSMVDQMAAAQAKIKEMEINVHCNGLHIKKSWNTLSGRIEACNTLFTKHLVERFGYSPRRAGRAADVCFEKEVSPGWVLRWRVEPELIFFSGQASIPGMFEPRFELVDLCGRRSCGIEFQSAFNFIGRKFGSSYVKFSTPEELELNALVLMNCFGKCIENIESLLRFGIHSSPMS